MENIIDKYNVNYSCGCVHEIEVVKGGLHRGTGNNKDCCEHKKVNENG